MKRRLIGFAGMTHLGVISAVAAAEKGFDIVGYDADPQRIAALQRGDPPVREPGLPELLAKNAARIRFAPDAKDLSACDLVYVAPDVPTDDRGLSDLGPIDALISLVDAALRGDTVMVFLSQVPPGFTRARLRPGRQLHYQVETLIFGRAVERALAPERIIVGSADPDRPLPPALAEFLASFGCPVLAMHYESAELAKISINICLAASIGVANSLAEICESIGADWAEIAPALKLDRRIGPHAYLAPGLGIAGGNLERDLVTVCSIADRHGADAGVIRALSANSRYRRDWALRAVFREVLSRSPDPVIAVLGLAYKQDTDSVKNSPSIGLLESLKPFQVRVFDPQVPGSAAPNPRRHEAKSELDACRGADALVVMTPWPQFGRLSAVDIAGNMKGRIVIDPYAVLDAGKCSSAGLRRLTLGVKA